MRPRKWVIIVLLCLAIVFSTLYQVFRFLEKHRNLEQLLIQGISSHIDGTFNVEKISIGFFSVHLKKISVSLPSQAFSISIKDIKIGFSFYKLLLYRGDFRFALNRVIINHPDIYLSTSPPRKSKQPPSKLSPELIQANLLMPTGLPLEYLTVKKGTLSLIDRTGDTIPVGEHLNGKMWDSAAITNVHLVGSFAASKDNLVFHGKTSSRQKINELSLKIDKAQIREPIVLDDFIISSGSISGTAELSFSDTFNITNCRKNCRVSIEDGVCTIREKNYRVGLSKVSIGFVNNILSFDTFEFRSFGSTIKLSGSVELANSLSARCKYSVQGFSSDSLRALIPDSLRKIIDGELDISGTIVKEAAETGIHVNFSINGLKCYNYTVRKLYGKAMIDSSTVTIDSLVCSTGFSQAAMKGRISYKNKEPVYSADVTIVVDSIPVATDIKGKYEAKGTIHGNGPNPEYRFSILCRNLMYQERSLGEYRLQLAGNGERIDILSEKNSVYMLQGHIESPFSGHPEASISMKCEYDSIKLLPERKPFSELDRFWSNATFSGWIDTFSVQIESGFRFPDCKAVLVTSVVREKRAAGNALHWQIVPRELIYKNRSISFFAEGSFNNNNIQIDSLFLLDGIRANGAVYLTSKIPRIEGNLSYNLSIPAITAIFVSDTFSSQLNGRISGVTRIWGPLDSLESRSQVHLKNAGAGALGGLQTDAIVSTRDSLFEVLPFVVRKDKRIIATFDTINNQNGKFRMHGEIADLDLRQLFEGIIPEDIHLDAHMSGNITSTANGLPLSFECKAQQVTVNKWSLDKVAIKGSLGNTGINLTELKAHDGTRSVANVSGYIPWSILSSENIAENETLTTHIEVQGDLLASIEKNIDSPIGGNGVGKITADIQAVSDGWHFVNGKIRIPHGVLKVRPFVLDDVKNFECTFSADSLSQIHTNMSGTIRKRPIQIVSTHDIPDGYEPFMIGLVNFGVLQVITPKKGVHLHLPGFMPIGELGDIEFAGKEPFKNFTLSGPIDRLKITGLWVLRDCEFTFPFLNTNELPWNFDPFPYVSWELDLKPGNQKVMYFWDLAGARRRITRFIEGYLDLASIFKVRGRDLDQTFRLYGLLRSYKGTVYYGKVFDRNLDVGVEFIPVKKNRGNYDNMPVLWGSAETFSDTSRFNRVKLTVLVHDSITGAVSERGRLAESEKPNISFKVTSDDDDVLPGEAERELYKEAGLTFASIEGVGEFMSNFGEQFFHRYLLQRLEKKLARRVGLDVINIESSIASNYFNKLYSRQFDGLVNQDDYLALANVGLTLGRYFFHDYLFLKARGELIPLETVLTPEYSLGLEFQPNRYMVMDINYGFYRGEGSFEHDPRMNLQLRLPITRIRNFFKF